MKQLSLLVGWIDGRTREPGDGDKILAYTWIEDPENVVLPGRLIQYQGRMLSGPTVRTYEKRWIQDGTHRKVAYWQPIEPLPGMTA